MSLNKLARIKSSFLLKNDFFLSLSLRNELQEYDLKDEFISVSNTLAVKIASHFLNRTSNIYGYEELAFLCSQDLKKEEYQNFLSLCYNHFNASKIDSTLRYSSLSALMSIDEKLLIFEYDLDKYEHIFHFGTSKIYDARTTSSIHFKTMNSMFDILTPLDMNLLIVNFLCEKLTSEELSLLSDEYINNLIKTLKYINENNTAIVIGEGVYNSIESSYVCEALNLLGCNIYIEGMDNNIKDCFDVVHKNNNSSFKMLDLAQQKPKAIFVLGNINQDLVADTELLIIQNSSYDKNADISFKSENSKEIFELFDIKENYVFSEKNKLSYEYKEYKTKGMFKNIDKNKNYLACFSSLDDETMLSSSCNKEVVSLYSSKGFLSNMQVKYDDTLAKNIHLISKKNAIKLCSNFSQITKTPILNSILIDID